jgi:hypothetical protein
MTSKSYLDEIEVLEKFHLVLSSLLLECRRPAWILTPS